MGGLINWGDYSRGGRGGHISGIKKILWSDEIKLNVSEKHIKTDIPLHVELHFIHLLCVTINEESISKTSIKHLCDWNYWNGTERQ